MLDAEYKQKVGDWADITKIVFDIRQTPDDQEKGDLILKMGAMVTQYHKKWQEQYSPLTKPKKGGVYEGCRHDKDRIVGRNNSL